MYVLCASTPSTLRVSPNSARPGYATEGALFISAHLSTDAVSALRKVRVLLVRLKNNMVSKHARKDGARPLRVKQNEFRLDSDDFGCTCDSVKPVLNWANVCSPNILRTVRRTMIRFLIELLVRRTWFGQSKRYFVLNWLVMRCKLRPELAADAQQTA